MTSNSYMPRDRFAGQQKWTSLMHNGVIFPPPYNPHGVKILYNWEPVKLTPEQEEVATMFAKMRHSDYVKNQTFRDNFWNDWRKLLGNDHVIQGLDACDFSPIYDWYRNEMKKRKQWSVEEKTAVKEEDLKQEEKYKWAIVDGVKKEVTNFRIIPPGLFKGRGNQHPESGKLMRRICPKDVTINIGKDALIPECPIPGESWKEIRHDNTVTWLAFYNHPINQKEFRYVFLAGPLLPSISPVFEFFLPPSISLKWQREKGKYEKARMLKDYIGHIRAAYTWDFTSEDSEKRQLAVATYLMDKLGLRAGTEKVHDDDNEADVVGCRRLKVENVKPISPNLLEFSFLGKDLIRYENTVEVDLPVYEAIIQFQAGKCGSDELFDKLDSHKLNAHLKELMPGLTAKVFHTYNASITLDNILNKNTIEGDISETKEVDMICSHQIDITESHSAQMSRLTEKIGELQVDIISNHQHNLTESYSAQFDSLMEKIGELQLSKETIEGDVSEKLDVYARANKEVAITCNHLRSISKTDIEQIPRLMLKIYELLDILTELKKYLDGVEEGESPSSPRCPNGKRKRDLSREELERKMAQTTNRIASIKRAIFCQKEDIVEMLGLPTSEIIDPRITVAWCRRHEVPIEKIFPKSLLRKFAWAMEVSPDFRF